jgi:hypothetical protein
LNAKFGAKKRLWVSYPLLKGKFGAKKRNFMIYQISVDAIVGMVGPFSSYPWKWDKYLVSRLLIELSGRWELRTARLHAAGGSRADVLSNPPPWWTPTAKAKAVVGIALALRFAHGLGLLHAAAKAGTVLFDADRRIQIADFSPIRLQKAIEMFIPAVYIGVSLFYATPWKWKSDPSVRKIDEKSRVVQLDFFGLLGYAINTESNR